MNTRLFFESAATLKRTPFGVFFCWLDFCQVVRREKAMIFAALVDKAAFSCSFATMKRNCLI